MDKFFEDYKKNGYLLIKNFFLKNEIEKILIDSKNIFLRQFVEKKYTNKSSLNEFSEEEFNEKLYLLFKDDFNCFSNCGKQIQHLISLHQLSLNDNIILLLKKMGIKSPIISTRPVLYFNHPKLAKQKINHTVDAHQDWRSMQGSLNSIVIWIPLININIELGALKILGGSHLEGLRTDRVENGFGIVILNQEEIENLVSIEVERGDLLLFSSFLIHQSGDNITNYPRWSCHFRYNDLEESTFIKRSYAHPYIYRPIDELITENFPQKKDIIVNFH